MFGALRIPAAVSKIGPHFVRPTKATRQRYGREIQHSMLRTALRPVTEKARHQNREVAVAGSTNFPASFVMPCLYQNVHLPTSGEIPLLGKLEPFLLMLEFADTTVLLLVITHATIRDDDRAQEYSRQRIQYIRLAST